MGDDQVTIDPEFRPSRRGSEEQGRRWGPIAVVAAVGLFIFGWLLGSPTGGEPDATRRAGAISTTTSEESTSTSAARAAESTLTTEAESLDRSRPLATLNLPLAEAVPGFTDTITMIAEYHDRIDVVRWRAWESAPDTLLSFPRDESAWGIPFDGWPVGLDASGRWYARLADNGTLLIDWLVPWAHQIDSLAFDQRDRNPPAEAIGLRANFATWHATEPGRLAWLELARGFDPFPITLYTLNVSDNDAQPAALLELTFDDNASVGINEWLTSGIQLEIWDETTETMTTVLLDDEGTETARVESYWLLAEGPDGTTLWVPEPDLVGAESGPFLLSPDGRRRDAVPGLEMGEPLWDAAWSPDGDHLALLPSPGPEGARVRIFDLTNDWTAIDLAVPVSGLENLAWSPDGTRLALSAESEGARSNIHIVELGSRDAVTGHHVTDSLAGGQLGALDWSPNGRFLVTPIQASAFQGSELLIHDLINGSTTRVPTMGDVMEITLSE